MAEPEPIQSTLDSKVERLKDTRLCNHPHCSGTVIDNKCDTCNMQPLGGSRPGSGFPVGQKKRKTLEAMKVKDAFNQRIMQNADKLLNAQMSLAVGEQVLMVVRTEGEGKNKRRYTEMVNDVEVIKDYVDWEEGIDGSSNPSYDENYYYLTTRAANNQAIDSLINRALGKVPEKLEVEGGFFSQSELTIKVVGSEHEDIDIGEDGQVIDVKSGIDTEQEAGPSGQPVEPSSSS